MQPDRWRHRSPVRMDTPGTGGRPTRTEDVDQEHDQEGEGNARHQELDRERVGECGLVLEIRILHEDNGVLHGAPTKSVQTQRQARGKGRGGAVSRNTGGCRSQKARRPSESLPPPEAVGVVNADLVAAGVVDVVTSWDRVQRCAIPRRWRRTGKKRGLAAIASAPRTRATPATCHSTARRPRARFTHMCIAALTPGVLGRMLHSIVVGLRLGDGFRLRSAAGGGERKGPPTPIWSDLAVP